MKQTFPILKKLCASKFNSFFFYEIDITKGRGIFFSEVDLRWGITAEQANTGEILDICLSEIDRCRPFFINLLGN